jgi:acyl carrier protein
MSDDVIDVIRETLSIRKGLISARTPISALVKDSIDMVELLAVLSDRYGIAIETDDLRQIKTVADVQAYVNRHRGTALTGADRF